MSGVLFRNALTCIISFFCILLLFLFEGGDSAGLTGQFNAIVYQSAETESEIAHELLASNDFSLNHRNAKDENLQHVLVITLRGEKLLRECIFDRDKIIILTQTLVWFTHSAYRVSLPPLWHPSIVIAHRRLII